jgi:hypothetical protein
MSGQRNFFPRREGTPSAVLAGGFLPGLGDPDFLLIKARKRERVRCSSLVDWSVYPRLKAHYAGV